MPKPNALFVMPYVIARERLTRSDLGRTPEPMVMDEPVGVAAFHEAGKIDGSNMPIYEMWAKAMSQLLPGGGSVLDLGSGSGRYLAQLARHRPDLRIIGLDLSDTMLATGRRLLEEEGLSDRITLLEADITTFDAEVPEDVDMVSSVFALHHLPTVEHLDSCLARIAAVRAQRGCAVFLGDFARLKNPRTFPRTLSTISGFPPALRPDAVASERAGWSLAEITDALERAGLGELHHLLASPLPLLQIHWAPAHGRADEGDEALWREMGVPRGVRFDTAVWRRSFRGLPQGDADTCRADSPRAHESRRALPCR